MFLCVAQVTVYFHRIQGSAVPVVDQRWLHGVCPPLPPQDTPSESSEAESSESDTAEDEEDDWDSGEELSVTAEYNQALGPKSISVSWQGK